MTFVHCNIISSDCEIGRDAGWIGARVEASGSCDRTGHKHRPSSTIERSKNFYRNSRPAPYPPHNLDESFWQFICFVRCYHCFYFDKNENFRTVYLMSRKKMKDSGHHW